MIRTPANCWLRLPRHPTQLYEALSYILIFVVLLIFYRKRYMKVTGWFYFRSIYDPSFHRPVPDRICEE